MEKVKLLVKITYNKKLPPEVQPLIALKKLGTSSEKIIREAIVKDMGYFDGDDATKLNDLVYQLSNGNYYDLDGEYRFIFWDLKVY